MPTDVMDAWLKSGRYARLDGRVFRPVEHHQLKQTPLSIQRGQAEAFFLEDEGGGRQILKKFHGGFMLDPKYLKRVTSLLPWARGLESGTQRQVLRGSDHSRKWGYHYSRKLAAWLNGTLLMPIVPGMDWASVADDLRAGALSLDSATRLALCRGLCRLVGHLEAVHCSHRDLSSGNVFIDSDTWTVSLIDFDSLYHRSLAMPSGTTAGTTGYAAPFAWTNGTLDANKTWCPHADRFALAILVAEFLLLGQGAPLTSDGGMFDQDELCARKGRGIGTVAQQLGQTYPVIEPLFVDALCSTSFEDCPTPGDWIQALDSAATVTHPPASTVMHTRVASSIASVQQVASSCAVPRLSDLPAPVIKLPNTQVPVVALPSDPWKG